MSAGKHNITIDQGATFSMRMTVKVDGTAKDLGTSGGGPQYAARGHLRLTKEVTETPPAIGSNMTSKSISFSCEGTGAGNPKALANDGIIDVTLTAAQTNSIPAGRYVYDIEIFTGTDNNGIVDRLIQGSAEVTRGITR